MNDHEMGSTKLDRIYLELTFRTFCTSLKSKIVILNTQIHPRLMGFVLPNL